MCFWNINICQPCLKSSSGPKCFQDKIQTQQHGNHVHNWPVFISPASSWLTPHTAANTPSWICESRNSACFLPPLPLLKAAATAWKALPRHLHKLTSCSSFILSLSPTSSEKPSWPSSTSSLGKMPCRCSHSTVIISHSAFLVVFGQFIGLPPLLDCELSQGKSHSRVCHVQQSSRHTSSA